MRYSALAKASILALVATSFGCAIQPASPPTTSAAPSTPQALPQGITLPERLTENQLVTVPSNRVKEAGGQQIQQRGRFGGRRGFTGRRGFSGRRGFTGRRFYNYGGYYWPYYLDAGYYYPYYTYTYPYYTYPYYSYLGGYYYPRGGFRRFGTGRRMGTGGRRR